MRATYLIVLGVCFLGTLPLEVVLRTRVYRRPRRLLLSLAPVLLVFLGWDVWAIGSHQWGYDLRQMSGVVLPGRLPLEELLFFLVIPACAILTLEAVRVVRGWPVGDEPAPPADDAGGGTGPARLPDAR